MFFFVVLNMEVSRCSLPWSVQCCTGYNPQGFCVRACVRLCVCVCTAMSFSSCYVYFSLVCFWVPVRCAFHPWTTHQSGALRGLDRERKRERDVGTPRKSKRETEKRVEKKIKSFKRLLTSKLTVIAALARGESTSKHTGWVMMWKDYKSKVIHNKQRSLCQLTYMRLVLRKKRAWLSSSKGLVSKGAFHLTYCTHLGLIGKLALAPIHTEMWNKNRECSDWNTWPNALHVVHTVFHTSVQNLLVSTAGFVWKSTIKLSSQGWPTHFCF